MPRLFLFGGPNGAGKTTIAMKVLPAFGVHQFANADEIARGLSPLDVSTANVQAGVLMMRRLRRLRDEDKSFGTESTLAARAFIPLIRDCQIRGYFFHLIYIWLPTPEMAIERVAARVRAGGHNIPSETIVRRYHAGCANFNQLYRPLADVWQVFDSSRLNESGLPIPVAEGGRELETAVWDAAVWEQIVT